MPQVQSVGRYKARARGYRSPSLPCASGHAGEKEKTLSEPEQISEVSNSPRHSSVSPLVALYQEVKTVNEEVQEILPQGTSPDEVWLTWTQQMQS